MIVRGSENRQIQLIAVVVAGISKPEQAEAMAHVSDGAIVGSAIVKIVAEHGEHADQALFDYVQSMKQAVLKAGA